MELVGFGHKTCNPNLFSSFGCVMARNGCSPSLKYGKLSNPWQGHIVSLTRNISSDFNWSDRWPFNKGPYHIKNTVCLKTPTRSPSGHPFSQPQIPASTRPPLWSWISKCLQWNLPWLKRQKLCKCKLLSAKNSENVRVRDWPICEGSFWRPFPNRHFHDEMQEMSAKQEEGNKNFGQTKKRVNLQGPDLLQSLGSPKLSNIRIP